MPSRFRCKTSKHLQIKTEKYTHKQIKREFFATACRVTSPDMERSRQSVVNSRRWDVLQIRMRAKSYTDSRIWTNYLQRPKELSGLLCTRQWTCEFHKTRGISWLAKELHRVRIDAPKVHTVKPLMGVWFGYSKYYLPTRRPTAALASTPQKYAC
jgi:hypothetical protein